MRFTIFQDSWIGNRELNEDRVAYCYSRDALMMVVADGMGGHHHGEVASQIAVQYLTEQFQRSANPSVPDPFMFLSTGLANAHHAILDYAHENGLDEPPRTTCVACIVQDNIAYWVHVGDSRLYLFRNGRLVAKTRDHSRVQLLVDQGLIDESEAATHPDRNKVYSCLGGTQPPQTEFSRKTPLQSGDVLMLSTDGMWGEVPPEEIIASLQEGSITQAMPELMRTAERRANGHSDNLSVVAVCWEDSYGEPTIGAISTLTLQQNTFTTQLEEFGKGKRDSKYDLSDDEIEKAIDEIRSAIQKYSK